MSPANRTRVALLLSTIVALVMASCSPEPTFISGTAALPDGAVLYLQKPYDTTGIAIDTAHAEGGAFRFSRNDLRGVLILELPNKGLWLIYAGDKPTTIALTLDSPLTATPYGDTLNYPLRENHRLVAQLASRLQSLSREFEASMTPEGQIPVEVESRLDSLWKAADLDFSRQSMELIRTNAQNPVGLFLLRQYMANFTPEQLEEMGKLIPATPPTPESAEDLSTIREGLALNANALIGSEPPRFSVTPIGGKEAIAFDELAKSAKATLLLFHTEGDEGSDALVDSLQTAWKKLQGQGLSICCLVRPSIPGGTPTRKLPWPYALEDSCEIPNNASVSIPSELFLRGGIPTSYLYAPGRGLVKRDPTVGEIASTLEASK